VDMVLYFEGSDGGTFSSSGLRVLRCHKNRFGPTHEVGIFGMGSQGLFSVDEAGEASWADDADGGGGPSPSPSEAALRLVERPPGVSRTACIAGSRGFMLGGCWSRFFRSGLLSRAG
jgi:hypothetical protein